MGDGESSAERTRACLRWPGSRLPATASPNLLLALQVQRRHLYGTGAVSAPCLVV